MPGCFALLSCTRPKAQIISGDNSLAQQSNANSRRGMSTKGDGSSHYSTHGGAESITVEEKSSQCTKQSPDRASLARPLDMPCLRSQSQAESTKDRPTLTLLELRDRLKEDRSSMDGTRGSKSVPLPSSFVHSSHVSISSRNSSPQPDRQGWTGDAPLTERAGPSRASSGVSFGKMSLGRLVGRGLHTSEVGALISQIRSRRRAIKVNESRIQSAAESEVPRGSRHSDSDDGFQLPSVPYDTYPYLSAIDEDRSKK